MTEFYLKYAKTFYVAMTALTATVVGVATAWPHVEPLLPAQRYWVKDQVQASMNPVQVSLVNVQVSMARGRQSVIDNEILKTEILVAKTTDLEEKTKYQFQLRKLNSEYDELDKQIRMLSDSITGHR